MTFRLGLGIALVVASGLSGLAQAIPSPPGRNAPRFEVASVKRHTGPDDPSTIQTQPGGQFTAIAMRVDFLVRQAYRVRPFQLMNGPSWISKDEFDVIAKAPENTPPEIIAAMLRALLAERFKLKVHIEKRELPVYALVLERPEAESTKLRRSMVDCDASREAAEDDPFGAFSAERRQAVLAATPNACSERLSGRVNNGAMVLDMVKPGTSMAALARTLSGYGNRLVIDRTGLTGPFDIALQFDPAGATAPAVTAVENAPTLFSALQEQLGLRLRSERSDVDVVVIDQIEPPTPD
jgi:uncharacterized protein (TIGR03435 family)